MTESSSTNPARLLANKLWTVFAEQPQFKNLDEDDVRIIHEIAIHVLKKLSFELRKTLYKQLPTMLTQDQQDQDRQDQDRQEYPSSLSQNDMYYPPGFVSKSGAQELLYKIKWYFRSRFLDVFDKHFPELIKYYETADDTHYPGSPFFWTRENDEKNLPCLRIFDQAVEIFAIQVN